MTPDEARRRILLALKRHDDTRAAEAKKLDGRKARSSMDDWRKTCEEIEEAGKLATARLWVVKKPFGFVFSKWRCVAGSDRIYVDVGRSHLRTAEEAEREDIPDAVYAVLAANNADRLARWGTAIAEELVLLATEVGGATAGERIVQRIAELWKESAK